MGLLEDTSRHSIKSEVTKPLAEVRRKLEGKELRNGSYGANKDVYHYIVKNIVNMVYNFMN